MKLEDRINTISRYYKEKYGFRVFKIGLSTGIECPKRVAGDECSFCVRETYIDTPSPVGEGRGEVVVARHALPIQTQIDYMIDKLQSKVKAGGYIAYFQDGTSFYGDRDYLLAMFKEADVHPKVLELIISTRPDYVDDEFMEMLSVLQKPLTIEIGVQSVHDKSLVYLNRGHNQSDNQRAIDTLVKYNVKIGVHIILGIPNESLGDVLRTAEWINENIGINDVKVHHLAVYKQLSVDSCLLSVDNRQLIDLESYIKVLGGFVGNLRKDLTISRLFTSNLSRHQTMLNDFPGVKRMWMNRFERYLNENDIRQSETPSPLGEGRGEVVVTGLAPDLEKDK